MIQIRLVCDCVGCKKPATLYRSKLGKVGEWRLIDQWRHPATYHGFYHACSTDHAAKIDGLDVLRLSSHGKGAV